MVIVEGQVSGTVTAMYPAQCTWETYCWEAPKPKQITNQCEEKRGEGVQEILIL